MGQFTSKLQKKRYYALKVSFWRWVFWGRKRWVLLADFGYETFNKHGQKVEIIAPAGMITDGGTVPRIIWWYVKPGYRKFFPAYVIHDVMRKNQVKYTRQFADDTFLEMLLALGAKKDKALNMYFAVSKW